MTPTPTDNRTSQVRAQSARLIENVIKAHAGKREIEVLLAIGSICPFGDRRDQEIRTGPVVTTAGTQEGLFA